MDELKMDEKEALKFYFDNLNKKVNNLVTNSNNQIKTNGQILKILDDLDKRIQKLEGLNGENKRDINSV